MKRSMVSRFGMVLFISFGASLIALLYGIGKFSNYEKTTLQALTGDQKNVVLGHVVESKLRALIEQIPLSVASQEGNELIHSKLKPILSDLQNFGMAGIAKELEEPFSNKIDSDDDLFYLYRNLKMSIFNLYRLSWNYKWMTVARSMSVLLADLESYPYQMGERGARDVPSRILQVTGIVTRSELTNQSKMMIFAQLTQIKTQAAHYIEAFEKTQKMRTDREAALKGVADKIKKVNESNSKGVLQFLNDNHEEYVKTVIVALIYALFAFFLSLFSYKRLSKYIASLSSNIKSQMESWDASLSSIHPTELQVPKRLDVEWTGLFDSLEKTIRKVNLMRKEDLILRRLLNIPVMLINQSKQAVYWNSSFSILGKIRAVEEMGFSPYLNIFKVTDGKGAPLDVVERAFTEKKEIQTLALLRSGTDSIPVFCSCAPLNGVDTQSEYVLVYLKDLREEFKRIDGELERQLTFVKDALLKFSDYQSVELPAEKLRPAVVDTIKAIKELSVDREQKSAILFGQIEELWERLVREGKLKNSLNQKTEQLNDQVQFFQKCISELKRFSEHLAKKIVAIDEQENQLKSEYSKIKARGGRLLDSLKESESLLSACIEALGISHEHLNHIRSQEKVVGSIIDRATLMNVNNTVLGSKKDLAAEDIFSISENLSQIISQFERCNHVIAHSIDEIDSNLKNLKDNIESDLNSCIQMAGEERAVLSDLINSEKMLKFERQDLLGLSREIQQFNAMLTKVGGQLSALEDKSSKMSEIGKASLALQEQMEKSFQGVLGSREPAAKSQMPA